jgi:hypothetical protein
MYKSPSTLGKFKAYVHANFGKIATAGIGIPFALTINSFSNPGETALFLASNVACMAAATLTSFKGLYMFANDMKNDFIPFAMNIDRTKIAEAFFNAKSGNSDVSLLELVVDAYDSRLLSRKQFGEMVNEEIFNKESSTVEHSLGVILKDHLPRFHSERSKDSSPEVELDCEVSAMRT